ncbi:hypothetical protein [Dyella nitratireducens]|uniref:hypothetical protein n=1 Tax=Dyella nitratireducens TaxID=1849580 RepID=UPI0016688562|nr:hypothetical protein [Dyella nitratireducens]
MPHHPDRVYTADNLRFATLDPKRGSPTLYFRTSHGSGRLRQVHKKGPLIQKIKKHTSHAFFSTKAAQRSFRSQFTKGMTRQEFRDLRRQLGGTRRPIEGYHHFEATFDAHAPQGKAYLTHPSAGTVVGAGALHGLRGRVNQIYRDLRSNPHTRYK